MDESLNRSVAGKMDLFVEQNAVAADILQKIAYLCDTKQHVRELETQLHEEHQAFPLESKELTNLDEEKILLKQELLEVDEEEALLDQNAAIQNKQREADNFTNSLSDETLAVYDHCHNSLQCYVQDKEEMKGLIKKARDAVMAKDESVINSCFDDVRRKHEFLTREVKKLVPKMELAQRIEAEKRNTPTGSRSPASKQIQ